MLDRVSLVRPSDVPFAVQIRWRAALKAQKNWSSPFLRPEFALAVGKVRDDARVLIAYDDQGMLGLVCIHKRPGGYARPLGAPVADHQAFITEAGFNVSLGDVLKAAGLGALPFSALNDPQKAVSDTAQNGFHSHIADLTCGSDAYFVAQDKGNRKHFKKMRQRARGAERDHGAVLLTLDSQNPADFSTLLQWKRDQYRRTRKCDVLAADWICALLHDLWQAKGPLRAVLNVFYLGGEPAAAEIGLMCNGVYHSWIAAYDPQLSRCSPGLLLLEGIMHRADELGITHIDLGAGHDHYKKYYANEHIALAQVKVLGEGLIAHQHRLLDQYGHKVLAGIPAKLYNSWEFIATCHPGWPGKVRGVAGRMAQVLG
jgi:CelD/BcsL family acetyltransferase involved in cellulose biosynthesis